MVSKNNRIKKMENAADRRQHFAIRKLTVGAASVLLGTTLWLGTNASTAHADIADGNTEPEAHEASDTQADNGTGTAEKVVVEQTKTDDNTVTGDNNTSSVSNNSAIEQSNLDESNDKAASNDKTNNETAKIKNDTNKIAATVDTSKLEQSNVDAFTVQSNNNTKVQNGVKDTHKENSAVKNTQADKVEQTVKDVQKTADSAVVSETAGINKINNSDLNKDAVVSDAGKLGKAADEKQAETVNFNLDDAALQGLSKEGSAKLATLFNTSLAVTARDAVNQGKDTDTNPKNDIDDKDFATAASWNDIQHAANLGAKGVKLTGDVSASGDLNINSTFTIESAKDATSNYSLNLGQNRIINNGNLTLDNITVNGSITGNGTVNIAGAVTSTDNSKSAANISAREVNVQNNAALTINRSSVGDGIYLTSNGTVNVADYGQLTINTNTGNDLNTQARYHNAGIFAQDNCTFTTEYKSVVNLNTSIGQGIAMTGVRPNSTNNDRFGGYTSAQSRSKGSGQINLGEYSTFNFKGRDGIILEDNSNFNVGQYANVHFENKGRGVALDLANNSNIQYWKSRCNLLPFCREKY